jgi:hypothetical protein
MTVFFLSVTLESYYILLWLIHMKICGMAGLSL